MGVEPIPGEPAALVANGTETALVIADYHAGIEQALRREGIELRDRAGERRDRVLELLAAWNPDELVVLGDLGHAIGDPVGPERTEFEQLFDRLELPVTLVKGNHDGVLEPFLEELDHDVTVTPTTGTTLDSVGFVHGHTWPGQEVLAAEVVCVGHEHPVVRLEDSVGGSRMERVWLRGDLEPEPFYQYYGTTPEECGDFMGTELVVFPAFNDLSGGTWVNVEGQEFLAPFLPDGLANGEAYLLDGTRLGPYRDV